MPKYTTAKPEASQFFAEPGDYKLKVIEATEDTSRGGNEMIKLKLRVIRDDGSEGPALFDYLVFSENSLWKIDAFLQSAGQHPGAGQDLDVQPNEILGYEVTATLTVETYEGKKNNKVSAYLFDEF